LDDGTNKDEGGTNSHADSSAEGINCRSDEWDGNNTANLVHGGDNTSPDTHIGDIEEVLELGDFQKRVKHRAIESIGSGAEESNETREVQDESCTTEISRRLLDQSCGINFIATDRLDLGNSFLVMKLNAVNTKSARACTSCMNLRRHLEP
jgi:hypothetical protein